MKSIRTQKVASLIQNTLSEIVRRELNDPRLHEVGMITITEVDLSPDHRNANVYVSFMGLQPDDKRVKAALSALHRSRVFLHNRLKKLMAVKNVPQLLFRFDNQFDNAQMIGEALQEARAVEAETERVRSSAESDQGESKPELVVVAGDTGKTEPSEN